MSTMEFANIRGLKKNLYDVHHHLKVTQPALLFLTETKISRPPDMTYLQYHGYKLEENFQRHAGVCLYVRSDVVYQRLSYLEHSFFNTLWVKVKYGKRWGIYVCIYRPHKSLEYINNLFGYLTEKINFIRRKYPTVKKILFGDINAHHIIWLRSFITNSAGRVVRSFAESHNLEQLVDEPTRYPDQYKHKPALLDLILASDKTGLNVFVDIPLGTSDHCLVKLCGETDDRIHSLVNQNSRCTSRCIDATSKKILAFDNWRRQEDGESYSDRARNIPELIRNYKQATEEAQKVFKNCVQYMSYNY